MMKRDVETGEVLFKCVCGEIKLGTAEDAIILKDDSMYTKKISEIYNPIDAKVVKDCGECGMDIMGVSYINGKVYYKCPGCTNVI
jgi:hypothetical protein